MMQIGSFRRNVGKTLTTKASKLALRLVSKNTIRTQIAHGTVALKGHTGRLLQVTTQYLLGVQQSQEMKDDAFVVLGDIGYDLALLSRVFKVKMGSITKKSKLVGTRSAAILQLDSLATDLLRQAAQALFAGPKMIMVTKSIPMPSKGGIKEDRNVATVDLLAESALEAARQTQMKSFVAAAVDVYWRLCFDMTGQPPAAVLNAKLARMQAEFPSIAFDTEAKKATGPKKGLPKGFGKKKAGPVAVSA